MNDSAARTLDPTEPRRVHEPTAYCGGYCRGTGDTCSACSACSACAATVTIPIAEAKRIYELLAQIAASSSVSNSAFVLIDFEEWNTPATALSALMQELSH